jgi:hypothetical protein
MGFGRCSQFTQWGNIMPAVSQSQLLIDPVIIQNITAVIMALAAVANLSIIYYSNKQYRHRALFDAFTQFNSHRKEL